MNAAKARLTDGKPVFGALIAAAAPELVEIAGQVGFDFITIDAEHEPIDGAQIAHLIRAAEAFDVT
ncbi:MAG: 4-hydroxy-2-oxovalerate aldolase, partial [bacterium]|nr:4-hydroxy-2-oxovalerate aldolase [bacterium]